jgi:WhiB family transcriptional regulator, redox-sensing transcriptional regulator
VSQEWRLRAECRDTDPDVPFAAPGSDEQVLFVKTYCRRCPVRAACLRFGLDHAGYGVYGGLNAIQRGRLVGKKQQPAERPVVVPECGTWQAYRYHREQLVEEPCQPCRSAWTEYCREKKRLRLGRTA